MTSSPDAPRPAGSDASAELVVGGGVPVDERSVHEVAEELEAIVARMSALAVVARSCRRLDDERLTRVQVLQGALSRLVGGLGVSVAAAIDARCGRELGRDGLASRHGQRSAKALIAVLTGCSETTAGRVVRLASATIPRPTLTGGDAPALMPELGEAVTTGRVHGDAGLAIVQVLEEPAKRIHPDDLTVAERSLVESASDADGDGNAHGHVSDTGVSADLVRLEAEVWKARLDPDGTEPNEKRVFERRSLTFHPDGRGGVKIMIRTNMENAALTKSCLSKFSDPRRVPAFVDTAVVDTLNGSADASSAADISGTADITAAGVTTEPAAAAAAGIVGTSSSTGTGTGTADAPRESGTDPREPSDEDLARDLRTTVQRDHDILFGLLAAGARSEAPVGGTPEIAAVIHADDLTTDQTTTDETARVSGEGAGHGWLEFADQPVPATTIRRLACFGEIRIAVTGDHNEITAIGEPKRLFTTAQRKALAVRDGGCAWLGCHAPPSWTEAHHVEWFSRGGATSIDNGVLLCSFHHHVVHQGEWQIVMRPGPHGARPLLIAPRYIDPTRRPRPMGRPRPVGRPKPTGVQPQSRSHARPQSHQPQPQPQPQPSTGPHPSSGIAHQNRVADRDTGTPRSPSTRRDGPKPERC